MMLYMTGSMCWRQVVMMLTRRMRWTMGSAVLWMPGMGRSWRQIWRCTRLIITMMVCWLLGGCQMWRSCYMLVPWMRGRRMRCSVSPDLPLRRQSMTPHAVCLNMC